MTSICERTTLVTAFALYAIQLYWRDAGLEGVGHSQSCCKLQ